MRLRRSDLTVAGVRRVRRGRGFGYGSPVDASTRDRTLTLAIHAAWSEVWVCPWPHGHIQAVGTDAAGRRQYIYHPGWVTSRGQAKHQQVQQLAARLPRAREENPQARAAAGSGRQRVGAVALWTLDAGLFRTGGEEYERGLSPPCVGGGLRPSASCSSPRTASGTTWGLPTRRSYVDPRVVDAYAGGRTIVAALRRLPAGDRALLRRGELAGRRRRDALERSVRRLIG